MAVPARAASPRGSREEDGLNKAVGSEEIKGIASHTDERASEVHVEKIEAPVWNNEDEVPELHLRTWIALGAMLILQFVQLLALQSPPAVVSTEN